MWLSSLIGIHFYINHTGENHKKYFFILKVAYEASKSATQKTRERCLRNQSTLYIYTCLFLLAWNRLWFGSFRAILLFGINNCKYSNFVTRTCLDSFSTLQNRSLSKVDDTRKWHSTKWHLKREFIPLTFARTIIEEENLSG